MRTRFLILLAIALLPATAFSETRLIAVDVRIADDAKEPIVSIYSDEKKEQKSKISIQETADILKKATGWGSMIVVGVQAHDVSLNKVMPLLEAISENGILMLAFLETSMRPSFIHDNLRKMILAGRKAEAKAAVKVKK
jgi:hypothetical protein